MPILYPNEWNDRARQRFYEDEMSGRTDYDQCWEYLPDNVRLEYMDQEAEVMRSEGKEPTHEGFNKLSTYSQIPEENQPKE